MVADAYVWPHVTAWPDWSAWSIDANGPTAIAETATVGSEDRKVRVGSEDRKVQLASERRTVTA